MTTSIIVCPHQHPVAPGASFCSTCGAPVEIRAPRPVAPSAYDGYAVPYSPAPFTAPPAVGDAVHPAPEFRTRSDRRHSERGPHRGRWIVAVCLLLAVIGGGAAYYFLAGGGAAVDTVTVTGQFVLTDSDTAQSDCEGQSGYNDIGTGATVILTNESGKILGSTSLDSGIADMDAGTCTYSFEVADVPKDSAQYAVEVTHRGKVVNSRAELEAADWNFFLSMGD